MPHSSKESDGKECFASLNRRLHTRQQKAFFSMNSAHSIKTCLSMAYLSLKTHRFIPIYSHLSGMGINPNRSLEIFLCKKSDYSRLCHRYSICMLTQYADFALFQDKMKANFSNDRFRINGNDFTCKSHQFRLNLQHTTLQIPKTKCMEKMKETLPQRKVTGRICIKTDLIPTATLRKAYLRRKNLLS